MFVRDPDGDEVSFIVDWGDGTSSGWQGPFPSDSTQEVSYRWSSWDSYRIRVKARDEHGFESMWSSLEVTMPKNRGIELFLHRFFNPRLESFFPLLRSFQEI